MKLTQEIIKKHLDSFREVYGDDEKTSLEDLEECIKLLKNEKELDDWAYNGYCFMYVDENNNNLGRRAENRKYLIYFHVFDYKRNCWANYDLPDYRRKIKANTIELWSFWS